MRHEVGVAHRDDAGRLWLVLSLGPLVVLGARSGRLETRRVREARLEPARGVTVDDLCQRWKVSVEAIDEAARAWLTPPPPVGVRRRGRRQPKSIEDAVFAAARTHALAYG